MASHLLKTAMWCAGSYSHVTIHEVVCRVPGYDVTHRGQQILESERGSVAGSPRHVITWIIWSVWNQWRDIPSCLCFRSSPDSTSTLKSAEHPIRRVDSLRCQSTRCFRRRVYIYIYIYIYMCVCVYIYTYMLVQVLWTRILSYWTIGLVPMSWFFSSSPASLSTLTLTYNT